jgi:hypothetical protein
MKNKTQSILWLAAIILGFLHGAATAQSVSPTRQEKTADPSTVNRSAADQDASERAAIEILEKHVEALGGRDAFAKIKSVETQIEIALLGRTIKARHINDVAGNRSLNRQDNGGNISETGYDGKRAWQKAPHFRGYLEASSPQAKSFARGGVRLPGASLYDYKMGGKKFVRLADEKIGVAAERVIKGGMAGESFEEQKTPVVGDARHGSGRDHSVVRAVLPDRPNGRLIRAHGRRVHIRDRPAVNNLLRFKLLRRGSGKKRDHY